MSCPHRKTIRPGGTGRVSVDLYWQLAIARGPERRAVSCEGGELPFKSGQQFLRAILFFARTLSVHSSWMASVHLARTSPACASRTNKSRRGA